MAIKTGSITAFPTKAGAQNTMIAVQSGFLKGDGSGSLINSDSRNYSCMLYGFNFEKLRELIDEFPVEITGLKLSITAKHWSSTETAPLKLRFVKGFVTSTSSTDLATYTDLGDGSITITNDLTGTSTVYEKTEADLSNTFKWIKSNLNEFLNGYTTNSFGIRIFGASFNIQRLTLTVTYTYEELEYYTVTTAVSPSGAGTVTPTHQVEEGSTATVAAIPNDGYKFSHWLVNGADSGVTSTTLSGVITANTTVTAVFVLDKINKIVCDTSKQPTILIDTQVVKAILIDTTKVYG